MCVKFKEEIQNYKGGKQDAKVLWCRMDEKLSNEIKQLAKDCQVYPAVVVRYILDKALDKLHEDESYRNSILKKTIAARDDCENFVLRKYLIRKDVNDKLNEANVIYRINNLSAFLCETAKDFFEKRKV